MLKRWAPIEPHHDPKIPRPNRNSNRTTRIAVVSAIRRRSFEGLDGVVCNDTSRRGAVRDVSRLRALMSRSQLPVDGNAQMCYKKPCGSNGHAMTFGASRGGVSLGKSIRDWRPNGW